MNTRLEHLIQESQDILERGIAEHVHADKRTVAGLVVLYSGGNDSTVLTHLFRHQADAAAHINTGIGIEATREFVRETCKTWGLPLIEKQPPDGSTYEELVLDQGFPGPGHHWKMYQRLKERGLREVRREFVKRPHKERVVFLAGRRREESKRRAGIPESGREGSIVWISPLVNWTKADLNTYREEMGDVPRNPVSDALHMSGECLCGAFAHPNELEEVAFWFPETAAHIRCLEEKVRATGKHPEKKCHWGWGAYEGRKGTEKSGALCSSCDARFTETTVGTVVTDYPSSARSRLRPRSSVFKDRRKDVKRQAAKGLGYEDEYACRTCFDGGCEECEELDQEAGNGHAGV